MNNLFIFYSNKKKRMALISSLDSLGNKCYNDTVSYRSYCEYRMQEKKTWSFAHKSIKRCHLSVYLNKDYLYSI